jgi:hypothetical protein
LLFTLKFFEMLELIEVVIVKIEKTNKLLRAHRGCLGFERR